MNNINDFEKRGKKSPFLLTYQHDLILDLVKSIGVLLRQHIFSEINKTIFITLIIYRSWFCSIIIHKYNGLRASYSKPHVSKEQQLTMAFLNYFPLFSPISIHVMTECFKFYNPTLILVTNFCTRRFYLCFRTSIQRTKTKFTFIAIKDIPVWKLVYRSIFWKQKQENEQNCKTDVY